MTLRPTALWGDGQTDDSSAVLAALAAIDKATGGTLYFPQGNYLMVLDPTGGNETLVKVEGYKNLTVLGQGPGVTELIIDNANHTNIKGFEVNKSPGFTIDNLSIRGVNRILLPDANDNPANAVFVRNQSPGLLFRNLEISWFISSSIGVKPAFSASEDNNGHGMIFDSLYIHNINQSNVTGASGTSPAAIFVGSDETDLIRDIRVLNSRFENNGNTDSHVSNDVYIYGQNATITGCTFIGPRPAQGETHLRMAAGLHIYPGSMQFLVEKNYFERVDIGIYGSLIDVRENTFKDCYGISLHEDDIRFVKNKLTYEGPEVYPYAILLDDDAKRATFIENIMHSRHLIAGIKSIHASGGRFEGNTFNNFLFGMLFKSDDGGGHSITDNTFFQNAGNAIAVHGGMSAWPGNVVSGNRIYGTTNCAFDDQVEDVSTQYHSNLHFGAGLSARPRPIRPTDRKRFEKGRFRPWAGYRGRLRAAGPPGRTISKNDGPASAEAMEVKSKGSKVGFGLGLLLTGYTPTECTMMTANPPPRAREPHASIYRREDRFIVCSNSRTTVGVWIVCDPFISLPMDASNEELGAAVLAALRQSKESVPHPEQSERRGELASLLKAAGVRSWKAFMNETVFVLGSSANKRSSLMPGRTAVRRMVSFQRRIAGSPSAPTRKSRSAQHSAKPWCWLAEPSQAPW